MLARMRRLQDVPTTVQVDALVKVARSKYANENALQDTDPDPANGNNDVRFDLVPAARQILVGRDISCQVGRMEVYFDKDTVAANNDTVSAPVKIVTEQSIKAEFPSSEPVRFDKVELETLLGDLSTKYMNVGTLGGTFTSDQGAIDVSHLEAACEDSRKKLLLATDLGSIDIADAEVSNCGVYLTSEAGPMRLQRVSVDSTVGDSIISLAGDKGAVTMEGGIVADRVEVNSGQGGISIDDVTPKSNLKLSTTTGDIYVGRTVPLDQPRISADTVQIETTTGNVFIVLTLNNGWFGNYHVTSQSGTVLIQGDHEIDVSYQNNNTAGNVMGSINCCDSNVCTTSNKTCAYGPEFTVSSISGDITVLVKRSVLR